MPNTNTTTAGARTHTIGDCEICGQANSLINGQCLDCRDINNRAGERTQHTKGPWTSNIDGQIQCPNLNAYGNWIVASIGRKMTEEDHTNARLIAAAPELLAACKKAILYLRVPVSKRDGGSCEATKLESAIAKAEGK